MREAMRQHENLSQI